jgi:hypothetical protein
MSPRMRRGHGHVEKRPGDSSRAVAGTDPLTCRPCCVLETVETTAQAGGLGGDRRGERRTASGVAWHDVRYGWRQPMTTTPQQPDGWPADDFVSTEELVRRRGVRPLTSVADLAADIDPFESDDEHDAFLADLYASRRADIG